ncbi:MAG TPA: DUF2147 domain-containing protein [Arsenicitalea sp.]|jgi:uncharacterized protein (DUF2147 family)|nr:DUF2147 domain-containing protein [Arsenicitalea sp.]
MTHSARNLAASKLAAKLAAAALIAVLGVAPTFAADLSQRSGASPVGSWETSTGESRYKVSLCGDGTALCAKLTWLRSDARTPANLPYLNTYVLRGAQQTRANKWQGTVAFQGKTLGGSLTLVSSDTIKLSGCQMVVCKSVEFHRIS